LKINNTGTIENVKAYFVHSNVELSFGAQTRKYCGSSNDVILK
jgi:hypothetical protein